MIIGLSGKKQHGKDTVCKIIQYLAVQYRPEGSNWTEQRLLELLLERDGLKYKDWWSSYKFKRKMFAEKLKQVVCLLINCTMEQLEDNDFKEKELGDEWDIYYYSYYKLRGNNNSKGQISKLYTSYYEAGKDAEGMAAKFGMEGVTLEREKLTVRKLLQLVGTEAGREIVHPNIWVNALMSEYKPHSTHFTNDDYPNWIISDLRFPNEAERIKKEGGFLFRVDRPSVKSTDNHYSEIALDDYNQFHDYIRNYDTIPLLIEEVKSTLVAHKIISI